VVYILNLESWEDRLRTHLADETFYVSDQWCTSTGCSLWSGDIFLSAVALSTGFVKRLGRHWLNLKSCSEIMVLLLECPCYLSAAWQCHIGASPWGGHGCSWDWCKSSEFFLQLGWCGIIHVWSLTCQFAKCGEWGYKVLKTGPWSPPHTPI